MFATLGGFVVGAAVGLAGTLWWLRRAQDALRAEVLDLTARASALQATLASEREAAAGQAAMLAAAEQKLSDAFKALSSEALQRNNGQFLELARTQLEGFQLQAKSDLDRRQTRIDETLGKFDLQLKELEKNRVGAYQSLTEQVERLMREQTLLRAETSSLVGALKQPTVRGRWGEIQLRRVVELAGMLDHCDFIEQHSIDAEEGRLRPDLIIKLPGGRHVIVDSKVPLSGYLAALEARDDGSRLVHLKEHARAVKTHIASLARKGYASELRDSAQFVVLFLPGEVFFSAALEQDPALIEAGVEQGVMIATPTSLIALLRAVALGWRQEQIAVNAAQISKLGKDLYERLAILGEHWAEVGQGLHRAVDYYNKATGSLESRVMVTARRFRDLDSGLEAERLLPLEGVDLSPRTLQDGTLPRPSDDPSS